MFECYLSKTCGKAPKQFIESGRSGFATRAPASRGRTVPVIATQLAYYAGISKLTLISCDHSIAV
jgi:hypothetical protein